MLLSFFFFFFFYNDIVFLTHNNVEKASYKGLIYYQLMLISAA